MDLKTFLSTCTADQRRAFCEALGKHPNYIHSLAAGALANGRPRKPSAALARAIEHASGQQVKRWELLPEVFDPPEGVVVPPRHTTSPMERKKAAAAAQSAREKVAQERKRKKAAKKKQASKLPLNGKDDKRRRAGKAATA